MHRPVAAQGDNCSVSFVIRVNVPQVQIAAVHEVGGDGELIAVGAVSITRVDGEGIHHFIGHKENVVGTRSHHHMPHVVVVPRPGQIALQIHLA